MEGNLTVPEEPGLPSSPRAAQARLWLGSAMEQEQGWGSQAGHRENMIGHMVTAMALLLLRNGLSAGTTVGASPRHCCPWEQTWQAATKHKPPQFCCAATRERYCILHCQVIKHKKQNKISLKDYIQTPDYYLIFFVPFLFF